MTNTRVMTTTYLATFVERAAPCVSVDNRTLMDCRYPSVVITLLGLGFAKTARQNRVDFDRIGVAAPSVPPSLAPSCLVAFTSTLNSDKRLLCVLNTSHAYGSFAVRVRLLDAALDLTAHIASTAVSLLLRPTVTGIRGCVQTEEYFNGTYGCKSGQVITIDGHYFSPVLNQNNVSFFSPRSRQTLAQSLLQCAVLTASTHRLTCRLRYTQSVHLGPYVVRVSTDKLTTHESSRVFLDTRPHNISVIGIKGCNITASTGRNVYGCVNGSLVRLTGFGFSHFTTENAVVLSAVSGKGERGALCLPRRTDGWGGLECVVRLPRGSEGSGTFRVQARLAESRDAPASSNVMLGIVPVITSIDGCGQYVGNGLPRQMQYCRAGDVITVSGVSFASRPQDNFYVLTPTTHGLPPGASFSCIPLGASDDGRQVQCIVASSNPTSISDRWFALWVSVFVNGRAGFSRNNGLVSPGTMVQPLITGIKGCAEHLAVPRAMLTLCQGDANSSSATTRLAAASGTNVVKMFGQSFYRPAELTRVVFQIPAGLSYGFSLPTCFIESNSAEAALWRGTKLRCLLRVKHASGLFNLTIVRSDNHSIGTSRAPSGAVFAISTVPVIHGVSGCVQRYQLTLHGCPHDAIITAHGTNFGAPSVSGDQQQNMSLVPLSPSFAKTTSAVLRTVFSRDGTLLAGAVPTGAFAPSERGTGFLNSTGVYQIVVRYGPHSSADVPQYHTQIPTASHRLLVPTIESVIGCHDTPERLRCTFASLGEELSNATLSLHGTGFAEAAFAPRLAAVILEGTPLSEGTPRCSFMPIHALHSNFNVAQCRLALNDASGEFFVRYRISMDGARTVSAANLTVTFPPAVTGAAGCQGIASRMLYLPFRLSANGSFPVAIISGAAFSRASSEVHFTPRGGASGMLRCLRLHFVNARRLECAVHISNDATGVFDIVVSTFNRSLWSNRSAAGIAGAAVDATPFERANISFNLTLRAESGFTRQDTQAQEFVWQRTDHLLSLAVTLIYAFNTPSLSSAASSPEYTAGRIACDDNNLIELVTTRAVYDSIGQRFVAVHSAAPQLSGKTSGHLVAGSLVLDDLAWMPSDATAAFVTVRLRSNRPRGPLVRNATILILLNHIRTLSVSFAQPHVVAREFQTVTATVRDGFFVDTTYHATNLLTLGVARGSPCVIPAEFHRTPFHHGVATLPTFYMMPRLASAGGCSHAASTTYNCSSVLLSRDFDESSATSVRASLVAEGWGGTVDVAPNKGVFGTNALSIGQEPANPLFLPSFPLSFPLRPPVTVSFWFKPLWTTDPFDPVTGLAPLLFSSTADSSPCPDSGANFGISLRFNGYMDRIHGLGNVEQVRKPASLMLDLPGARQLHIADVPFDCCWHHVVLSADRHRVVVAVNGSVALDRIQSPLFSILPEGYAIRRFAFAAKCSRLQFYGLLDNIQLRRQAAFDQEILSRLFSGANSSTLATSGRTTPLDSELDMPCAAAVVNSEALCTCDNYVFRGVRSSSSMRRITACAAVFGTSPRRSCNRFCEEACDLVAFAPRTVSNLTTMSTSGTLALYVENPTVLEATFSPEPAMSGSAVSVTVMGVGLGIGDQLTLNYRSTDDCLNTSLPRVVPIVRSRMETDPLVRGKNSLLVFSLMAESSGPHLVCYWPAGLQSKPITVKNPLSLATRIPQIVHLVASVNVSTLRPVVGSVGASVRITILGRGLSAFFDIVTLVADGGTEAEDSTKSPDVLCMAQQHPPPSSFHGDADALIQKVVQAPVKYSRTVSFNATFRRAGCFAVCYHQMDLPTPVGMSQKLCIASVARSYTVLSATIAGDVEIALYGFGFNESNRDQLLLLPPPYRCNSTVRSRPLPTGFEMRPSSKAYNSASSINMTGWIAAPGTYQLCFLSWVPHARPYLLYPTITIHQSVNVHSARFPRRRIIAAEQFHITVNGTGLSPVRDRIVALESTSCDPLRADPISAQGILFHEFDTDLPRQPTRSIFTFVTKKARIPEASVYIACYYAHAENKWFGLNAADVASPSSSEATNFTVWARVQPSAVRSRGVNHATISIVGQGLDQSRDRLLALLSIPGKRTCPTIAVDQMDPKEADRATRFGEYGRAVLPPERGRLVTAWNVSLSAAGTYLLCYQPWQYQSFTQMTFTLNVTSSAHLFSLFVGAVKPTVGVAFNFTVSGVALSSHRDRIRIVLSAAIPKSCTVTEVFIGKVSTLGISLVNPAADEVVSLQSYSLVFLRPYKGGSPAAPAASSEGGAEVVATVYLDDFVLSKRGSVLVVCLANACPEVRLDSQEEAVVVKGPRAVYPDDFVLLQRNGRTIDSALLLTGASLASAALTSSSFAYYARDSWSCAGTVVEPAGFANRQFQFGLSGFSLANVPTRADVKLHRFPMSQNSAAPCDSRITVSWADAEIVSPRSAQDGLSRITARVTLSETGRFHVCYNAWFLNRNFFTRIDHSRVLTIAGFKLVPTIAKIQTSVPGTFMDITVKFASGEGIVDTSRTDPVLISASAGIFTMPTPCRAELGVAVCRRVAFLPGWYGQAILLIRSGLPSIMNNRLFQHRLSLTVEAQARDVAVSVLPHHIAPTASFTLRALLVDAVNVPVGSHDPHTYTARLDAEKSAKALVSERRLHCRIGTEKVFAPCPTAFPFSGTVPLTVMFKTNMWPVGQHDFAMIILAKNVSGRSMVARFVVAVFPDGAAAIRALDSVDRFAALGVPLARPPVFALSDEFGNLVADRAFNSTIGLQIRALTAFGAVMLYSPRALPRVSPWETTGGPTSFVNVGLKATSRVDTDGVKNVSMLLVAHSAVPRSHNSLSSPPVVVTATQCPPVSADMFAATRHHFSATSTGVLVPLLGNAETVRMHTNGIRCILKPNSISGAVLGQASLRRIGPCTFRCPFQSKVSSANATLILQRVNAAATRWQFVVQQTLHFSGPAARIVLAPFPAPPPVFNERETIKTAIRVSVTDSSNVPRGDLAGIRNWSISVWNSTVAGSKPLFFNVSSNAAFTLPPIFVAYPYYIAVSAVDATLTSGPVNLTALLFPVPIVNRSCSSPPIVTIFNSSSCVEVASGLARCDPNGNDTFTLVGNYFQDSGASVVIGGVACKTTVHDSSSPFTVLRASGCVGDGLNNSVSVVSGVHYIKTRFTVSFQSAPSVARAVGCSILYPHVVDCDLLGRSVITVFGRNFGPSGAQVFFFPQPQHRDRFPVIQAARVVHVPGSEETMLNVTGFKGFGENYTIAVRHAAFNRTSPTAGGVMMSFLPSKGYLCPVVTINGVSTPCGLRAVCDLSFGVCICDGNWERNTTTELCDHCLPGFYGDNCQFQCPGGSALPCTGTSHGYCFDGVSGNGTCACVYGYTGLACERECPGGFLTPCNGHGVCTQQGCTCMSDPANGFWAPPDCASCQANRGGSLCTAFCPIAASGVVCGNGTCSSGGCLCNGEFCGAACDVSGASCRECSSFWGPNCSIPCPAWDSLVCAGHGVCSSGRRGTGSCACLSGYIGPSCQYQCPGGFGNPCSKRGTCVSNTTCACNSGFVGFACELQCPGTTASICSNHGTCTAAAGRAVCTCSLGYRTANCSVQCPGGADNTCSARGTCNAQGTCDCVQDPVVGFWAGTACTTCAAGYYGPICTLQCPKAFGLQCGGNGICTNPLAVCVCSQSEATGFWTGDNCGQCQSGYYGPKCVAQCPGGACVPCNNHGTCNQGYNGTGMCTCFRNISLGFWQEPNCNDCVVGFWGRLCLGQCISGQNGLVCSGHGNCDQGVTGSGACICQRDSAAGFWDGTVCDNCLRGYYGARCLGVCPLVMGVPCNGEGACSDGLKGNGTCQCNGRYVGRDCSQQCPATASRGVCNRHGRCVNGTFSAFCVCDAGFTGNCDECQKNFYGPACQRCPCALEGTRSCSDGILGAGSCECKPGYAGLYCNITCAGGSVTPCSLHGACSPVDGTCTCDSSNATGFYSGPSCAVCMPEYQSLECRTRCPMNGTNAICSGHGDCFNGNCYCDVNFCGSSCELQGRSSCDQFLCAPLTNYGPLCDRPCPANREGLVCSDKGFCNAGKAGDGQCVCRSGFSGSVCEFGCPGAPVQTCSNHGACVKLAASSVCSCFEGFAGPDCSIECPGRATGTCSNRGLCLQNSTGNGTCRCFTGFGGFDCSVECPGGAANPCYNHGVCNVNGTCECTGNFTGPECLACVSGFRGPQCRDLCVHGITSGTRCVCHSFWSGLSCTVPCPGLKLENCADFDCLSRSDANCDGQCVWDSRTSTCFGSVSCVQSVCSGRGTCFHGELGNGTCACSNEYFGALCNVRCTQASCAAIYNIPNAQCDSLGECACQDNDQGHFDDLMARCTTCKEGFYGPTCTFPCNCNNRGRCDQVTGICRCAANLRQGFWAGATCNLCQQGYAGASCNLLDVKISRLATTVVLPGTQPPYTRGVHFRDPQSGILHVASKGSFGCLDKSVNPNNGIPRQPIYRQFPGTPFAVSTNGTHVHFVYHVPVSSISADSRIVIYNALLGDTLCSVKESFRSQVISGTRQAGYSSFSLSRHMMAAGGLGATREFVVPVETSGVGSCGVVGLMSNGDLLPADPLAPAGCVCIMPSEFFLRAVHAVYDTETETYFTVGQGFNGSWVGVATQRDTGISGKWLVRHWLSNPVVGGSSGGADDSESDRKIDFCESSAGGCTSALRTVIVHRFLLVFLRTTAAVGVVRYKLDDLSQTAVSTTLLNAIGSANMSVTAVANDTSTGLVFASIVIDSDPAVVVKFYYGRDEGLFIRGTMSMGTVGFDVETVAYFTAVPELRQLWALVQYSDASTIVSLAMFSVESVFPSVADTAGSTPVTVSGEGFVPNISCSFGGIPAAAQFVDSNRVICSTPSGGDEICEGRFVEVKLNNAYTENQVRLKRSATPSPRAAVNAAQGDPFGYYEGGVLVNVTGFGFVDSNALSCRFSDATGMAVESPARFITTALLQCVQPATPRASSGSTGVVQVSLDGAVWSAPVAFTIIGPAGGIAVTAPAADSFYKSSSLTELAPSRVDVVDNESHPLLYYDSKRSFIGRVVNFTVVSFYATQSETSDTSAFIQLFALNRTIDGRTFFQGSAAMRQPIIGRGLLRFSTQAVVIPGTAPPPLTAHNSAWSGTLSFVIEEGEPHRLAVLVQPTAVASSLDKKLYIKNDSPKLTHQPIVTVLDISDNTLHSLLTKNVVVQVVSAQYFNGQINVNSSVFAQPRGTFEFSDISMRGLFGSTYRITFTAVGVLPTTSEVMHVANCDASMYGISGTTTCAPCPPNAICNGSYTFDVQDGYWRASAASYFLYSCDQPFGTASACRKGECTEGYSGARCTQCMPGYGTSGSSCSKCMDASTNIFVTLVIFFGIAGAFCFLIYTSFKATKKNPLPVLLKILINHLQVGAQLGGVVSQMPSMMLTLIGYQQSASSADPSAVAAVSCVIRWNFYQMFVAFVVLPWIAIAIAFFVLKYLHKWREHRKRVEAEMLAQRRDIGPFRTEDEYHQRLFDIGLRERNAFWESNKDEKARDANRDALVATRRAMLLDLHKELDSLRIVLDGMQNMPESETRELAAFSAEERREKLSAQLIGIEDEFMWARLWATVAATSDQIAEMEKRRRQRKFMLAELEAAIRVDDGGASTLFGTNASAAEEEEVEEDEEAVAADLETHDSIKISKRVFFSQEKFSVSLVEGSSAPEGGATGGSSTGLAMQTNADDDEKVYDLDDEAADPLLPALSDVDGFGAVAVVRDTIPTSSLQTQGHRTLELAGITAGLSKGPSVINRRESVIDTMAKLGEGDDEHAIFDFGIVELAQARAAAGETDFFLITGNLDDRGNGGEEHDEAHGHDDGGADGADLARYAPRLRNLSAAPQSVTFNEDVSFGGRLAKAGESDSAEKGRGAGQLISGIISRKQREIMDKRLFASKQRKNNSESATSAAASLSRRRKSSLDRSSGGSFSGLRRFQSVVNKSLGTRGRRADDDDDDEEEEETPDDIRDRIADLLKTTEDELRTLDTNDDSKMLRRHSTAVTRLGPGSAPRADGVAGPGDEPSNRRQSMVDLGIDVDGAERFAPRDEVFEIEQSDSESASDGADDQGAAEATVRAADALPLGRQFMLSAVVIFLLLYPTLITRCLQMVRCETIDFGPPSVAHPTGGTRTLLYADRSIDCNTPAHSRYTRAALAAGLSYGIGIPLTISLVIVSLMRTRGVEEALSTFAFYTAGYDSKFWWWEGVILTRKLALISISVFVQSDGLRLYIAMWFLSAALIGHIQAHPFVNPLLHNMETLSLATIVITLNLALLFPFAESKPVFFFALAIVVVSMNIFAIGSIFAFMLRELAVMFAKTISQYSGKLNAFWNSIFFVRWYKDWKAAKEAEQAADDAEQNAHAAPHTEVRVSVTGAQVAHEIKKKKKKGVIARIMDALEGKNESGTDDAHHRQQHGKMKSTTTMLHVLSGDEAARLQARVVLRGRADVLEMGDLAAAADMTRGARDDENPSLLAMGDEAASSPLAKTTAAVGSPSEDLVWIPPEPEQAWRLVVDKDQKLLEILHDDVMQQLHVDLLEVVELERKLVQTKAERDALTRELEMKRLRQQYFSARDMRSANVTGRTSILKRDSAYGDTADSSAADHEAEAVMARLAQRGAAVGRRESTRLRFHVSGGSGGGAASGRASVGLS